jgi:proton glutamate symport protein
MELIDFIGNAFIRLIQMIVIPLVCSAIIVGISSIGESKQLGKFGKKMLIYYSIITIAAVCIGATLVVAFQPGIGIQEYISKSTAADIQSQFATM